MDIAYITCSWGVEHVGYVLICYGAVDATLSVAFGPILRRTGRAPIFILGALINIAIIAVYFFWKPDPSTPIIYFVIAGFWGAADAVWQTQINAFYGFIFPDEEEAAFSNYRFWESVGFIIGYANSNIICTRPKLYILTSFLIVGMTCFLIIEVKERRKRIQKTLSNK
ncbi:UNC93-like protein [Orchesella cincta]|uniref:UNC93-like protein n=1 Tax=Orchesella cincta TaxID=48709 RepID=A0A1D2NHE0_ORCCI|nr:UNC93-like protein [Orchesella cincta]